MILKLSYMFSRSFALLIHCNVFVFDSQAWTLDQW